jgi:hypothetical protein
VTPKTQSVMKAPIPVVLIAALLLTAACEIMPQNTLSSCRKQCKGSKKSKACYDFCERIHKNCQPLDKCLADYDRAPDDAIPKR